MRRLANGIGVIVIGAQLCCASSSATMTADASGEGRTDGSMADGAGTALGDGGSSVPTGEFRPGIATYYDATGAGNCSFDPSPEDLMVAAMNQDEWAASAVCGACAEVMGPSGTVIVRIVDRCPECRSGHLDLSREAFARIAPLERGRVDTRWRFVTCPVRGPVSFKWKDSSNPWWAAIQVRNHRLPVRSIEARAEAGGAYQTLERQEYNFFVGTNLGPGPFELRVTAQGGQQIIERNVRLGDNVVVMGTQQFE